MEFAEACMQAMYWHRGMGGKFDPYLDTEEYYSVKDEFNRFGVTDRVRELCQGLYTQYFGDGLEQQAIFSDIGRVISLGWKIANAT